MRIIVEAGTALGRMLRDGWRVFVGNWPTLFAVFFLGSAFRGMFVWLAVEVSKFSPLISMFLLPLAPISLLVALVIMLRSVAPTLPDLRDSLAAGAASSSMLRMRSDLSVAIFVLVPFLAVYASQGLIKEDLRSFTYSVTTDEWMNQGFAADFSRVTFASETQMIMIVIVALVLRKVIAGFDLAQKSLPMAGFAGYLEALWLVSLAAYFAWSMDAVREWVLSRAIIQQLLGGFDTIIASLGAIGSAINAVIGQISALLSSMGALVIVPVAWIAVGATIYGSQLRSAKPLVTSEQMTMRITQIPHPIRRVAAQVSEPVVTPFRNTVRAIERVATAGIIPMVMLCLIFAFTSQLRVWTTQGLRLLIGPHDNAFWTGFGPYVDVIAQAVYNTVMVALLAAAVSTIIHSQRESEGAEEVTAVEPELSSGAPATVTPAQKRE